MLNALAELGRVRFEKVSATLPNNPMVESLSAINPTRAASAGGFFDKTQETDRADYENHSRFPLAGLVFSWHQRKGSWDLASLGAATRVATGAHAVAGTTFGVHGTTRDAWASL